MNNITPSIASDLETVLSFTELLAKSGSEAQLAAERLSVWLATFTPNHLDDSSLEH